MELTPYLETLHRDLAAAAAAGDDFLGSTIESSGRLCLLEALSDAAAEITAKLESASVEVRLRGREAQFVVAHDVAPTRNEPAPPIDIDGDVARITLRLPESLKEAVEAAAAVASMSVNAWLVRAITTAVAGPPADRPTTKPERSGRRYTGFAQA
jgi:predicted HicB family RNase H-like nuclease